jgi:ribosomal protein S12 methylthiotransferase accessory factor
MSAWLTGESSRPIELDDSLDPALRDALAGIASLGGTIQLRLLAPSACGTTVIALAFGDGERWPGVVVGLAADLDPALALRGAILELCQTGPHLRRLLRSGSLAVPPTPEAVHTMLDHAAYYFPAARATAFNALLADDNPVRLASLGPATTGRSRAECAAALAQAGVRVAIVDVTAPDVAMSSFRVVRAVSPHLQSISFGHGLDRAPVERIRSRAQQSEAPPIHPIW